jgi:hypothetical protein
MKQNFLEEDLKSNFPSSPKVRVTDGCLAADGKYYDTFEQYEDHVMSVTGTTDPDLALSLINSLARSQGEVSEKTETAINNTIGMLAEFRPGNLEEALLASHIIALNSQFHSLLIKANAMSINPEVQREHLKMAFQISNKVSVMIEKLQKYRRNSSYQLRLNFTRTHSCTYTVVGNTSQQGISDKSASSKPEVLTLSETNKRAASRFKDVPIPEQIPLFE